MVGHLKGEGPLPDDRRDPRRVPHNETMRCPVCGAEVPQDRRRTYCSVRCRRTAEAARRREKAAAPFLAVTGVAPIADRDELLRLLWVAARNGSVGAMRLLIEEFRRDGDDDRPAEPLGSIDEIAARRERDQH